MELAYNTIRTLLASCTIDMKNNLAPFLAAMVLAGCCALLLALPGFARADSGPGPAPDIEQGMCIAISDDDPPAPVIQPDPGVTHEVP